MEKKKLAPMGGSKLLLLIGIALTFLSTAFAETKNSGINLGPVTLSGYFQPRFRSDESANDSFDIRRARLDLSGALTDYLKFKVQAELAGSSARLMDAYLHFTWNSHLQISGGQFKLPFSAENLISASKLETINRSQVVESLVARSGDILGNQNGRDIGAQVSGSFLENQISYGIAVVNGAGINTNDHNDQKDIVGRLVFTPLKQISIGGSFYEGTGLDDLTRDRAGAEAVFRMGAFSARAEYIRGKDDEVEKDGWYLFSGYYVVPERLQALVRFDTFDADRDSLNGSNGITTLGVNYFFYSTSFLAVNYEIHEKDETNLFVAQLTLVF